MTPEQLETVREVMMKWVHNGRLFHGACHGADRQAHTLWSSAREMFPSNESQHRWAHSASGPKDAIHIIDPNPLRRNRTMVDFGDLVLAAPSGGETLRSGTWATIRYARKCKTPVIICWPDGSTILEGRMPHASETV